jgi:subtilisin-like proprotein convertase family protein
LKSFIKIADGAEKDIIKLRTWLIEQISLTEDDIDMEMNTYRTISDNEN